MRAYDVKILDQPFRLKSDENEDHIHRLTQLLQEKVSEIQGQAKNLSPYNTVVLTALNLADDLLKHQRKTERFQQQLQNRIHSILELVRSEEGLVRREQQQQMGNPCGAHEE